MIRHRLCEWGCGFGFLGFGLHSLFDPDAFMASRVVPIMDLIYLPLFLLIVILSSVIRLIALYFSNKFGVIGGHVRAVCSGIGGLLLLELSVAVTIASTERGMHVTPIVWFFMAFSAVEFVSTSRARADAKHSCRR